MASVDIKGEIDQNYDSFYDFFDTMVFEIARYLKPHLPLKSSTQEGELLKDIRILNRDVFDISEKYFKTRCAMDPKKVNFEKMAGHFVQSYKDCLTKEEIQPKLKLIEEDILDVITDAARKEIYN
ncbi:MAG: hypothetical protein HQL32_00105 [Planctomycetes bacterium]|nr:hypothetical protein [Planctomycetota bacterium]